MIKDFSHWMTLSSFKLSDGLTVTKYRSNVTGLTVVLASADSPIVNGYFCLATEVGNPSAETFLQFLFRQWIMMGYLTLWNISFFLAAKIIHIKRCWIY